MFLGMIGVPPAYHIKKPKQKGGRLSHMDKLGLDLYAAMMGVKTRLDNVVGIWR